MTAPNGEREELKKLLHDHVSREVSFGHNSDLADEWITESVYLWLKTNDYVKLPKVEGWPKKVYEDGDMPDGLGREEVLRNNIIDACLSAHLAAVAKWEARSRVMDEVLKAIQGLTDNKAILDLIRDFAEGGKDERPSSKN